MQLDDAVVAGLGVDLDAGVLGRAGLLLVGRQQRVLERGDELLGGDALLARQGASWPPGSLATCALLLDEVGTVDVGVRDRDHAGVGGDRHLGVGGADELAGEAYGGRRARSRVRTRARRPRKRRKWSGLVSGRSRPGEETSSA